MKKVLLGLAICALALSPMFSGGTKDTGSSGVTKIRVWTDNASDKDVRTEQVKRFNEGVGKQHGIEIEYTVYGANYHDMIRVAVQAGEAPEIFRATGEDIQQFSGAGALVPITDMPGGQAMVDQYKGQLITNSQIFNGKVYSLPYSMTTFKLIVNKDLFRDAGITTYPKTWAEVRTAAKTITDKNAGRAYGFVLGLQSAWVMRTYLIGADATNTGLNAGFNNETLKYEYSKALPAISAVVGMIRDGSMFPGFEGLDADQMRAQFATGRVGMIPGASFDVGVYTSQFPAQCDWMPIDIPAHTASGSPYVEFVDASNLLAIGVAGKKNADKTMEVYKFFYSDENLGELYEKGLYVPFRQEALKFAKNPPPEAFQIFANLPKKAILLPTPENEISVEGLTYRETIAKILADAKTGDPAATLADLERRYNAAVAKMPAARLEAYRQSADRNTRR